MTQRGLHSAAGVGGGKGGQSDDPCTGRAYDSGLLEDPSLCSLGGGGVGGGAAPQRTR